MGWKCAAVCGIISVPAKKADVLATTVVILQGTVVNRTNCCYQKKVNVYLVGFCVYRSFYLIWPPVIAGSVSKTVILNCSTFYYGGP